MVLLTFSFFFFFLGGGWEEGGEHVSALIIDRGCLG